MTTMIESDCTHMKQLNTEGEKRMGKYDPKNNDYVNNYKKEHYKRLQIEFDKDYYVNVLAPAAEAKGLRTSTFVREAVKEKIERESKGKRKE